MRHNLAIVLHDQGRYAEARREYEDTVVW
ncbi:tetratricopeptide repeat protein [Streptomyces sp. uw30]